MLMNTLRNFQKTFHLGDYFVIWFSLPLHTQRKPSYRKKARHQIYCSETPIWCPINYKRCRSAFKGSGVSLRVLRWITSLKMWSQFRGHSCVIHSSMRPNQYLMLQQQIVSLINGNRCTSKMPHYTWVFYENIKMTPLLSYRLFHIRQASSLTQSTMVLLCLFEDIWNTKYYSTWLDASFSSMVKKQNTRVLPSHAFFSVMIVFYQPVPSYFRDPESVPINNLADKWSQSLDLRDAV